VPISFLRRFTDGRALSLVGDIRRGDVGRGITGYLRALEKKGIQNLGLVRLQL
jgi:hypothetical protein